MSIILFIIILLVLVLVHEFGHFIVAKKNGIRVDEFGFGFPPRAVKLFHRNGTDYTLNWLPFGGFVKIFGQDGDESNMTEDDHKVSFSRKPRYVQAMVLVAGIVFNILLAWVLFSVSFMSGMPASTTNAPAGTVLEHQQLTLIGIKPASPAFRAGLMSGDVIVSLNDQQGGILKQPSVEGLIAFVSQRAGKNILVTYDRKGVEKTTTVTPELGILNATTGGIGVSPDMVGTLKLSFFKSIYEAGKLTITTIGATFAGFGNLIYHSIRGNADLSSISGPVGLVSVVGNAYHFGWAYLISFVALISINLAVINLIPFPALDGGRLLFLLIEKIKGSRINQNIANTINLISFGLLMILILVITYHDIKNLF